MIFSQNYFLLVMIPTVIMTLFAQWRVRSAYKRWSEVRNSNGYTGLDTARAIMGFTGLDTAYAVAGPSGKGDAVKIGSTSGVLTDHYDPRDKTIYLSESSTGASVAAMAIVAHELGHAEQDRTGNAMLNLRASLVPAANIGSNLGIWIILAGLLLQYDPLAWVGVGLFSAMVAFTLVTLPVEFDASRRAKKWLTEMGLVSPQEREGVDAVLNAAALTYVAAAAAAVLNLLHYVTLLTGRSRD